MSKSVKIAEKATKAFVACTQIPRISSVRFEGPLVRSSWTHTSVSAGTNRSFARFDTVEVTDGKLKGSKASGSMPITSNETSISHYSSDIGIKATIYKNSAEFILEVWNNEGIVKAVNLNDLDAHGDVYLDDQLGSVVIDSTGQKIAYIAEEKRPKPSAFTKGFGVDFKPSKGMLKIFSF